MGLDWNPLARPKPGMEAEFDRLLADLDSGTVSRVPGVARWLLPRQLTEAERAERLERFRAISEAPYVTMGAPRVGFDAAADAWLHARLEEKGKLAELPAALEKMHGYYVLDLLPACDGFPRYSNYPLYEGLDRYSFRAQFLDRAKQIIGPQLHDRAYQRMRAPALEKYAAALETVVRPWAARAGVAAVEHATEPPEDAEDSPAEHADILFCAIRWCRFWAARGHGLEPWF